MKPAQATKTSSRIRFAVTLLLMAATLAAALLTDHRAAASALRRPLDQIPTSLAGWSLTTEAPLDTRVLSQLRPTSYLSRRYGKGEQQLDLLIVYYAQQRAGESMHSPEHCLPGAGWQIQSRETDFLPLDGRQVKVNRYRVAHAGETKVMYYWYQSKRRVIAEESLGKALLAWDALASGRTEGSLVRITLPDTPLAARDALDFAAAVLAEMQKSF